jgi:hypothetical protein
MGLTLLSQPAQAISLNFAFDGNDNGLTTISKTVGGVTMTASNINSNPGDFWSDAIGIILTSQSIRGNQFNISFDQAVQFASYTVIQQSIGIGETATFALSNPNGASSTGNDLANVGTFNFNSPFTLNAGQTSTLTAILSNPNIDYTAIKSITVDYNATPVPWETDTLPVIGSTVLFGGGVWAKRKFAARTKLV